MFAMQLFILSTIAITCLTSVVIFLAPFSKSESAVYGCRVFADSKDQKQERVARLPWTERILMCPPSGEAKLDDRTRCDAIIRIRGRFVKESSQESSRNVCTISNELTPGMKFTSECAALTMRRSRDGQDIHFVVDSRGGWRGGILVTQTTPSDGL